ncbi:MAG: DUF1800 family protein [Acidimicrobiales bacterium]|nr:DUF1800 family protein [Acidimicrobiales bacterium]
MAGRTTTTVSRRAVLAGGAALTAVGALELAGAPNAGAAGARRSRRATAVAAPAPLELAPVIESTTPGRSFEQHLISRATFGWTPALEAEVRGRGWTAWLDEQLAPSTIDDGAITAVLAGYRTLQNTNQANHVIADTEEDGRRLLRRELAHSTFLRALHSRKQLYEVMVDFWTNHFNVFLYDTAYEHLQVVDNRSVARAHALGRFADLLSASAHSPAMLVYLNNARSNANSADGVNENYGREVLELHTLGIIDGEHVYTEADVVGVAKVLSGWSVNITDDLDIFRFRSTWHHTGAISLLGGQWSCPAHSAANGQQYGESLLDFLAHHESTARYLSWKLVKRFVSDDPPPALVDALAGVYLANDTRIAPVLRHLFHSDEFAAAAGLKLRRGFEILAATCRVIDAQVDPDPLGDVSEGLHGEGWGALFRLGQPLFGHRNPDGFSDDGADWLSADGLLRRWDICGSIANNWYEPDLTADPLALVPSPPPPTAGTLLDAMAVRILGEVGAPHAHGFTDVAATAWYGPALDWARDAGIVTAYTDGSFHPKNSVKRSQIVEMIWRAEGSPTGAPPHGFTDVPPTAPYGPALRWAKAQGIVEAYPDGTFRPKRAASRAQVVMMLWSAEGEPGGSPRNTYTDVANKAWYRPGVDWAAAQGLIGAYPGNTFRPEKEITRSSAVSMLYDLHHVPVSPLSPNERSALLTYLGGNANQVTHDWFLEWKTGDLVALLLATPAFQHR